jgi:hypothetical protein
MSQHDQVINDGNGASVRSDINAALAALFSTSLGSTEPSVKNAGMLWFDTSVVGANVLKVRDQTNTAWLQISPISQPSARAHRSGGGAVALTAATWTKINFSTLAVNVGGFSISGNSLLIPRAGTYLVHGSIQPITTSATVTDILCGIAVNGAVTTPVLYGWIVVGVVGNFTVQATGILTLAAAATLQLTAYSSIAGASISDAVAATGLDATMVSS